MMLRRRRAARSAPARPAPVVEELFAAAQDEAIALRHDFIGTEHVLLALVAREDKTGRALRALGIDLAVVRRDVERIVGVGPDPDVVFDSDALATIGVDFHAVRERVEATFGTGSLERAWGHGGTCHGAAFGVRPRLKQALARARDEAARRDEDITAADVALGLAEQRDSVAAQVFGVHAISAERLRAAFDNGRDSSQ
jgi:ATP-dependent Clp protease ATP-binding subunit ClpA